VTPRPRQGYAGFRKSDDWYEIVSAIKRRSAQNEARAQAQARRLAWLWLVWLTVLLASGAVVSGIVIALFQRGVP